MFAKHFTSADFITIGKSGMALLPARPFCFVFTAMVKMKYGLGQSSI